MFVTRAFACFITLVLWGVCLQFRVLVYVYASTMGIQRFLLRVDVCEFVHAFVLGFYISSPKHPKVINFVSFPKNTKKMACEFGLIYPIEI